MASPPLEFRPSWRTNLAIGDGPATSAGGSAADGAATGSMEDYVGRERGPAAVDDEPVGVARKPTQVGDVIVVEDLWLSHVPSVFFLPLCRRSGRRLGGTNSPGKRSPCSLAAPMT